MKQRILLLLISSILCASVISCDDFLEEKPQAIAAESFYNTASEVESGIAAIYPPFRMWYSCMIEVQSDLLHGRASWAPPSEFQGLNTTNISRVSSYWGNFYRSIRNANIVISRVPQGSSLTDAEKSKYLGEAKFLRAYAYFQLVRNWGAVPLRDETNMTEIEIPRSPVSDIYDFMISDLTYAEENLESSVSVSGHPSKWAAKTLLADVYFFNKEYDKAAAKAKEVMDSEAYSLVEVTVPDDFENLYGADITSSTEEIFFIKYNENYINSIAYIYHGVGRVYINQDGYYAIYSNRNFPMIKNWDDNDLRKQYDWYDYSGFDEGTILLKKWNDKTGVQPRNDFPVYKYSDLLLIYAEASCRASGKPTAEGVEALNMVHRRAYGKPSTQPSSVDFSIDDYDEASFIDLCMQERAYETVGEGKRWLDLVRAGVAAETIQKNMGKTVSNTCYLWPIPVSELNYNSAITDQNPGY